MKILSVVGARPQFVKLAPVAHELETSGHEHIIVHTGQHYDVALSDVFFTGLGVRYPHVNLQVGSGSHAEQTGAMLPGIEKVILEHRPDWVLVYGDTNSTMAAALAAVKIHQPVAHLEAGLRSFNRRMPEEHNRVLTDHAADLLLAPTSVAVEHLRNEGLADRTVLVGDVMTDVLYRVRDAVLREDGGTPEGEYFLATIHRAENTDARDRLAAIIRSLARLPRPVMLVAHPRLRDRAATAGIELETGAITVLEPQTYHQMVALVARSSGVVTDSGGLQKEAFLLRVPCTTLRYETEWVETVELGWNVLDGPLANVTDHVLRPSPPATDAAPYGLGDAAERVVNTLANLH